MPAIYENEQFSQEFQLLYSGDRMDGIIGFYYLDATASTVFDVLLATTGDLIGLPGLNAQTFGNVETDTWSIFADFTYDLTPEWSLSVGGRYTHDERSSRVLRRTYIGGFSEFFRWQPDPDRHDFGLPGLRELETISARASPSPISRRRSTISTPASRKASKAAASIRAARPPWPSRRASTCSSSCASTRRPWTPTRSGGSSPGRATGTRSPSSTMTIPTCRCPAPSVRTRPETGVPDTFTGITTNAGAATIWGIEYEGNAALAEDAFVQGDTWNFNWAVGYLNGQYDQFINAFGVDISDQAVIQNSPEWMASGTLAYNVPLANGDLSVINTLAYRGSYSQFEIPNALLDQDGYTLWNASVVWNSGDGRWQAGLHGRNLTNERYKVSGYNFINPDGTPNLGLEGTLTAFYGDPRTVTATFAYRF